jgi:nucleoside-diphosphate-sugar epimerase
VAPEPGAPATRIVVTGATGFVGRAVARVLRGEGREVVAPVRDRGRAAGLAELGVTVVDDDLSDVDRLAETFRDADAIVHAAGSYRVGVQRDEHGAMWDANIGATTRVLDAAEAARVRRIVYVSTVGVFGNTRAAVVDETYRRNLADGFVSWYDQTKYGAHEVAEQRIAAGAPIVVVQPSQVYGPGDHTAIGEQLERAYHGRLRYVALADVGVGFVHVDDVAAGIVAALDRGRVGESYVLSGPRARLGEAIAIAARLGGHEPPRLRVPTGFLRAMAPLGRLAGQANLAEVISASSGVTYWASAEKAERELGFQSRSLEDGLRATFEARS